MLKRIILFLLIVIIGAVFYFSWLSDPSLQTETYLPEWLISKSNEYYNLRTAIPFVGVGFLLETYTQFVSPNQISNKKSTFMQNLGIATIIVFLAEGGQFFIQTRNPDVMDVYFGIIGSLIGGMGYNMLSILMNFKRYRNAK
jgi:glycopeptide antibiotics resistance protein